MTDPVKLLARIEDSDVMHEGRLLILVAAFTSNRSEGIRGLTKLAKLDFLLRYPTYLERALECRQARTSARVQSYERQSVESRMVRYRFGPWDHRYPRILRRLQARGLVQLERDGRALLITATAKGLLCAEDLKNSTSYTDIEQRARALKTHFDLTATNLMKFIYETFPEVVSLSSNQEIDG